MQFNFFKSFLCALFLVSISSNALAATQVKFETNQGSFTVELYLEKAPVTVANFVQYVKDDFYKKTIFHRVINGFMIQGGGFERDLFEKNTRAPIKNESDNGLKNKTGTLAMARTLDPNSATSQFFINLNDNVFLDYTSPEPEKIGYCVFGKVVNGMEVIKKMGRVPTGNISIHSNVPIIPITF
jgi:cyclophilin family peptidyl-prolyl cis-trans isomerase